MEQILVPAAQNMLFRMHRLQHAAMNTQFEIRCTHPDAGYATQAAMAAFDVVDRLELQLSRFVENSDISRINHLEPGESTLVSYETMQCLQLATLIHGETRGAFDIAVGTGFDALELAAEEFVVRRRPSANLRLDLGAIGKGYAVDRIADVLDDWEIEQALIDAGSSSVLALDPPAAENGWPLTISDPADSGRVFARIVARQRALGASGIRKVDHIVDPSSGEPVRARSAAWVSASRLALDAIGCRAGVERSATAVADALSTAFMIASKDDIAAFCSAHPGLDVWILAGEWSHFPAALGADNG